MRLNGKFHKTNGILYQILSEYWFIPAEYSFFKRIK